MKVTYYQECSYNNPIRIINFGQSIDEVRANMNGKGFDELEGEVISMKYRKGFEVTDIWGDTKDTTKYEIVVKTWKGELMTFDIMAYAIPFFMVGR